MYCVLADQDLTAYDYTMKEGGKAVQYFILYGGEKNICTWVIVVLMALQQHALQSQNIKSC